MLEGGFKLAHKQPNICTFCSKGTNISRIALVGGLSHMQANILRLTIVSFHKNQPNLQIFSRKAFNAARNYINFTNEAYTDASLSHRGEALRQALRAA